MLRRHDSALQLPNQIRYELQFMTLSCLVAHAVHGPFPADFAMPCARRPNTSVVGVALTRRTSPNARAVVFKCRQAEQPTDVVHSTAWTKGESLRGKQAAVVLALDIDFLQVDVPSRDWMLQVLDLPLPRPVGRPRPLRAKPSGAQRRNATERLALWIVSPPRTDEH
jgi:hypothetical protein